MSHCPCNFVPSLAEFGEISDLVGLTAPRPLFVEVGTHDSIFPIAAVRSSLTKARWGYDLWNVRPGRSRYFFGPAPNQRRPRL